jgi:hypothetical protein
MSRLVSLQLNAVAVQRDNSTPLRQKQGLVLNYHGARLNVLNVLRGHPSDDFGGFAANRAIATYNDATRVE